jgi:hypothetical protein
VSQPLPSSPGVGFPWHGNLEEQKDEYMLFDTLPNGRAVLPMMAAVRVEKGFTE